MDTDTRSINELPIDPRPVMLPSALETPIPLVPAIKPLELWAFLENSDFVRLKNGVAYRQDEVNLIRHDEFLEGDYRLMVEAGCVGIRDAARWYLSHPAPGIFDWSWMDRVVEAADKHNLKLYLDLWHYGYPDWLDVLSAEAPVHFAEFARSIACRYPTLQYYCVCNEPSLLVELAGRQGDWSPFLREEDPSTFRRQISKMIIAASKAILEVKPDAVLIIPEPWHATDTNPEDNQAAVLDTVMGLRDPDLGGCSDLVTIVGLNHYRDSTLPPFHRLLLNAQKRWPNKSLWVTETSGPPTGWQQAEWFWWMLAETRLALLGGANIEVFTWAPAISMYDWVDETLQLHNGIWILDENGQRLPNGKMPQALELARQYGYLC
ncbi:MAG: beta-galactosidase [Byssovorax cruenta]